MENSGLPTRWLERGEVLGSMQHGKGGSYPAGCTGIPKTFALHGAERHGLRVGRECHFNGLGGFSLDSSRWLQSLLVIDSCGLRRIGVDCCVKSLDVSAATNDPSFKFRKAM